MLYVVICYIGVRSRRVYGHIVITVDQLHPEQVNQHSSYNHLNHCLLCHGTAMVLLQ